MTKDTNIPEADAAKLLERPDGFYWQDAASGKTYGPFKSAVEAKEDILYRDDSDYEEGESLLEAEDEIGIAGWIDPDTHDPAEYYAPRFSDDE